MNISESRLKGSVLRAREAGRLESARSVSCGAYSLNLLYVSRNVIGQLDLRQPSPLGEVGVFGVLEAIGRSQIRFGGVLAGDALDVMVRAGEILR